MKSEDSGRTDYTANGGELPLHSPELIALMQEVVAKGLSFRFKARGFSMSPFIKDGDVITVRALSRPPHFGDVVAFQHPVSRRLVVHRVIGRRGGGYLIKGDAGEEADGLVPADNLLARVTAVERDDQAVRLATGPARWLIAALTRSGLFLRVVIPTWLLVRPLVRRSK